METLHVSANDIYSNVYFDIDVPNITKSNIIQTLESSYKEWSKKLTKTMGGHIRVCNKKRCVAKGTILWWWDGGHTIQLEVVGQDSKSQDASGDTSVCHEDYPRKEQSQPTCCAFV